MSSPDLATRVRWLYLDMNSFFASVEQEMDPRLRGKPVAVVPLLADTTCCIAVSYEGKAFGVKTGTLVGEAKRLCPGIELIEGDHENYVRYHHRIVEAVESCLPVEAVCSIDEIAARLTGSQQDVGVATALADKIKGTIKTQVGATLRCSIGLAPNRYLAKIAADMKKPDGLTVVRPCDLPAVLYPLKLRDLPGVGARMEARLKSRQIRTMERLCALSEKELRLAWGSVTGLKMWHLIRGEELPETETCQQSSSHSHVLPPALRNPQDAARVLKKLTTKAAMRLRAEGFWATAVDVFARFAGQDGWKARCTLPETQDTLGLLHAVGELWKGLPDGDLYAVGVALSGLVPDAMHVPSLFDDPRQAKLTKALDQVNARFGKEAVHFGATHDAGKLAPLRIAFARIPDESEL
ncbi:MAG: DNA polymerase [Deltaproteobacteria bacterium]|nr:DNA polymerase [Deltaproteobacteria bacterium]